MSTEKLAVGLKNSIIATVTESDTAEFVGSGSLAVLATPRMLTLMEKAAADLAESALSGEYTSVGTLLNVRHTAPTPVGMNFRAEVELVEVDNRRLVFEAAAFDDAGEIGRGMHERFIVNREKFQQKADAKNLIPNP